LGCEMNTTGKKGYWPIVQELRPGPNDGEEPGESDKEDNDPRTPLLHSNTLPRHKMDPMWAADTSH
jgi:hypothetical protein